MADASVLYCVQSWYHPEHGVSYLDWLESKHMAEVLAEPGIVSARRVTLDQTDEKGWPCCLLVYEMTDRAAIDAYLESPSRERFWRELDAFEAVHYSTRFRGDIDFRLLK